MTTQHRYTLLQQVADGRPPKTAAADQQQQWKPRMSVMWVACLLLIVFLILVPILSPDYFIDFIAEERSEMRHGTISPSTHDHMIPPPPDSDVTKLIDFSVGGCNIWRGDWIPHHDAPPYTNETCPYIQENQNCIKLGRTDLEFLHWRWKPHKCELPLFDAKAFLKIVAGKKWMFIGDSLARNNFQSVVCHLAQVEVPNCTYNDGFDGNVHWYFRSYNFTLAIAWAPFFVKGFEQAEGNTKGVARVDLDVVEESWAPSLHNYDYIVLSGGRWYARSSVYYVQNELVGCNWCPSLNATDVGFSYAYGVALRTVFDFLISSQYKGVVFFRTFSPEHWENAPWDQGGNCTQKAPFKSTNSTAVDGFSKLLYKVQLEEFGKAVQRSSEYSFKLKIVDGLHALLLRPDAHPGPYGHFHPRVLNDCVHWCLPGAVDAWSAMILHVLKHL